MRLHAGKSRRTSADSDCMRLELAVTGKAALNRMYRRAGDFDTSMSLSEGNNSIREAHTTYASKQSQTFCYLINVSSKR